MLRKTVVLIVFLMLCSSAFAGGQVIQFLLGGLSTLYGGALNGGLVYSYAAGTTTAKAIYSDVGLTEAYDNPATLDTDGRLIAYGSGSYKFVIKDSKGTTIFTADNVEIKSVEAALGDATDPFGNTLTQTNLIVTNLDASDIDAGTLNVTGGTVLASLSMNSAVISNVASGVLNTDVVNVGQLTQALASYTIPTATVDVTKWDVDCGKFHRVATWTIVASATWEDAVWDLTIASETTTNVTLASASTQIKVARAGRYEISGCLHSRWTGGDNTEVFLASRVLYSTDGGATWEEARCLQVNKTRVEKTDGVDTQHYIGSVNVPANTLFKLQVYVSSVQLLIAGWPGFDNPVALTFHIYHSGPYIE